jgi:hypothetical protein
MSKKQNNLQYVKHVPDFLVKMGLTNTALKEHQEKHAEPKLEDKFPRKAAEEDKEEQ